MYFAYYLVNCSAGHHSEIIDNIPRCVECEQGTYNGLVGQGQCTRCRGNSSTLETGLITDEQCQGWLSVSMGLL